MRQLTMFDMQETPAKTDKPFCLFTDKTDGFDYEADDAEAVVFLISPSGKLHSTRLYVMRRHEAQAFCSRPETKSNNPARQWAYVFTTHLPDWRDELDTFRADDGRFDGLLAEMGITPIYSKKTICPKKKELMPDEM